MCLAESIEPACVLAVESQAFVKRLDRKFVLALANLAPAETIPQVGVFRRICYRLLKFLLGGI